jgi:hypothetical protein
MSVFLALSSSFYCRFCRKSGFFLYAQTILDTNLFLKLYLIAASDWDILVAFIPASMSEMSFDDILLTDFAFLLAGMASFSKDSRSVVGLGLSRLRV